MTATEATRHPTGITLTPYTWSVQVDDRHVGDISLITDVYAAYHELTEGGSHPIGDSVDDWTATLDEAIGQILACDRDPEQCARTRTEQLAQAMPDLDASATAGMNLSIRSDGSAA